MQPDSLWQIYCLCFSNIWSIFKPFEVQDSPRERVHLTTKTSIFCNTFPPETPLIIQLNNLLSAFSIWWDFALFLSSPFSCYGGLGRSGLSKNILLILFTLKVPLLFFVSCFLKIFDCLNTSFYIESFVKSSLLILCHCSDHMADVSHVFCPSVAACLLLQLSVTMTANKAIEILREHRGGGAIQTVKVRGPISSSPNLLYLRK